MDVLLVRAADVPEYVQDGVVECGVTGADLVRESGAKVEELLRLGFGACTLEAAVPAESSARSLDDLDGLRVATVYPRLAAALLRERGVSVDLVSSGSTLRTNGLRSVEALFSSEAVLVGGPGGDDRARELATVLRSVVEARETRYLMLNAPESALEEITKLVPGSAAPSVLPLAVPGMVAIHALVPAADVWRLLPRLEAAGGSSILLVPIERMLA